jgi:hypothetical protein
LSAKKNCTEVINLQVMIHPREFEPMFATFFLLKLVQMFFPGKVGSNWCHSCIIGKKCMAYSTSGV